MSDHLGPITWVTRHGVLFLLSVGTLLVLSGCIPGWTVLDRRGVEAFPPWETDVEPQFICPDEYVRLWYDTGEPPDPICGVSDLGSSCPEPNGALVLVDPPRDGWSATGHTNEHQFGPVNEPTTTFTFHKTGGRHFQFQQPHTVDVVQETEVKEVFLNFPGRCAGDTFDLSAPEYRSQLVRLDGRVCNNSPEKVYLRLDFAEGSGLTPLPAFLEPRGAPGSCTRTLSTEEGKNVILAAAQIVDESGSPPSCELITGPNRPFELQATLICAR